MQFGDGGFRGIEQAEEAVDEVCFVFRLYELGKTVKEFGGIYCHDYDTFIQNSNNIKIRYIIVN